jgi:hypothetical protein
MMLSWERAMVPEVARIVLGMQAMSFLFNLHACAVAYTGC